MIRFLQISDIHFADTPGDDDEYKQMKSKFLEDIAKCHKEMGCIDYILICGDIAFSGMESQYKEAKNFISKICEKTECPEEHLFVVPGNHDKKREVYIKTRQIMRDALLKGKSTKLLLQSKVKEPMAIGILYAPFKPYYIFASEYSCISDIAHKSLYFPESDQETGSVPNFEPNDAFYWSEQIGELGGMPVFMHGSNSALLSDKDDGESTSLKDDQHLQVLPLQAYNITATESEIHILMLHHPLSEIQGNKEIVPEIDSRFRLQLYGHIHKQSSSSDGAIHIYSGALQPPEAEENREYFPVYNVIEMDVVAIDNSPYLSVNLFSRKWNGAQFEAYTEETKVGEKALIVKLTRNDAWEKTIRKLKSETKETDGIKKEKPIVYPHAVKHRFLQSGKEGTIIKQLYKDRFDKISPNRMKYLEFLKQVELDNKINELNDILKSYGK